MINSLDNAGMSGQQTLGFINNLVNQQAATMAVDDLAWLSAVLFIVMIALIWLIHPIRAAATSEAASGGH
jgi:MFS transporter, DHA2 family, multidrug resistance protein